VLAENDPPLNRFKFPPFLTILRRKLMHTIISLPDAKNPVVNGQTAFGMGYHEDKGTNYRRVQEDTLTWHKFEADDLPFSSDTGEISLSPDQLDYCLWSALMDVNQKSFIYSGSTVTTTLYDGRGHFTNATLGDALTFLAVYDTDNKIHSVIRLNPVIHNVKSPSEIQRVNANGGYFLFGRLGGGLAVSRAVGDLQFRGITAAAPIHRMSIDEVATTCNLDKDKIGNIQIIACCDGYTEPLDKYMTVPEGTENPDAFQREQHEIYLMKDLQAFCSLPSSETETNESELARYLVDAALNRASTDNISVVVQTVKPNARDFFMVSVHDGHGGDDVSTHIAKTIGPAFQKFCQMPLETYEQHPLSVFKNQSDWERDNRPLPVPVAEPQLCEAESSSAGEALTVNTPLSFFQPAKVRELRDKEFSELNLLIDQVINTCAESNVSLNPALVATLQALINGEAYSTAITRCDNEALEWLKSLDTWGVLAFLETAELEASAVPAVL
jgi:serine/threonine protein phosphatase PrpC